MILLDAAAGDGMGLAALILSGGGGGGLLLKFISDKVKMKAEIAQLKIDLDKSERDMKEKILEATASKKALREEIRTEMEKKDQILHARIDRVRDDNIKSYEKLENKITQVEKKMDDHTQKILDAINKK